MARKKRSGKARSPGSGGPRDSIAEAEEAVDWPAEDADEASFRDADEHTLDVPMHDRASVDLDPEDLGHRDPPEDERLDDDPPDDDPPDDDPPDDDPPEDDDDGLTNVRWAGEPTIESLPAEALHVHEEPDFDSVDVVLDDLIESAPPAPIAAGLDEDVIIEPADGHGRALVERATVAIEPEDEPVPTPPPQLRAESPPLEAPGPVSPVSPVSPVTPIDDPSEPAIPEATGRVLVAVAGGKGGAGRSLLVANLGLFIAHLGRDVVVCDLAPDGANLHTFLGLEPRLPTTGMMLRGAGGIHVEQFPGLRLRLCRSPMPIAMGGEDPLRKKTLAHARGLDPQVLVLDLGTHADPLTLDNFNEADAAIVVVTPEPIAMERTYAFLRAALYRRLLFGDDEAAVVARALLAADHVGQLDTPGDLVAAMRGVNPAAAVAIAERVRTFSPMIVMNHCRSRAERQMGKGIVSALRHRWGITAEAVSALEHDDAAVEASRRRRPLMMEYPGSTLGASIDRLARRLVSVNTRREVFT